MAQLVKPKTKPANNAYQNPNNKEIMTTGINIKVIATGGMTINPKLGIKAIAVSKANKTPKTDIFKMRFCWDFGEEKLLFILAFYHSEF